MSSIEIKPNKLVEKFSDIEHIVNAVSARMDEPGLEGKEVLTTIVPADKMPEAIRRLKNTINFVEDLQEEHYNCVNALHFKWPKENVYSILLKSRALDLVIPTYFHELCHIANYELCEDLLSGPKLLLAEALAVSFRNWAMDEFNQISPLKYQDRLIALLIEKERQYNPENIGQKTDLRRVVYDVLLWRYNMGGSSKEIYHWFKAAISDKGRLERLSNYIEKHFLEK